MLRIVSATMEDARDLFEWQNDPLTLAMSGVAAPVEWDAHVTRLDMRLRRRCPFVFIADIHGHHCSEYEISPGAYSVMVEPLRGKPVATFHVDDRRIFFAVAPAFRGRGV